jgi:hypothetical protein
VKPLVDFAVKNFFMRTDLEILNNKRVNHRRLQ